MTRRCTSCDNASGQQEWGSGHGVVWNRRSMGDEHKMGVLLEIGRGKPRVKISYSYPYPPNTLTPAKGKGICRVGVRVFSG